MHTRAIAIIIAAALAIMMLSAPAALAETSLEEDIDTYVHWDSEVKPWGDFRDKFVARVKKESSKAFDIASKNLKRKDITDLEKWRYVLILGHTGEKEAVKLVIAYIEDLPPDDDIMFPLRVLARLGGDDACKYMIKVLDKVEKKEDKMMIFHYLAGLHYAPALDRMEYLLLAPFNHSDIQSLFEFDFFPFARMGNSAVPWLIKRLDSPDENLRINSAVLLGYWIVAPEASEPLMKLYAKETDPEARDGILFMIARTTYDIKAIERFLLNTAAKDQEPDAKTRADARAATLKTYLDPKHARSKANPDRKRFDAAYARLNESLNRGRYDHMDIDNDLGTLIETASYADIERLIALRERLLGLRLTDGLITAVMVMNETIIEMRYKKGK